MIQSSNRRLPVVWQNETSQVARLSLASVEGVAPAAWSQATDRPGPFAAVNPVQVALSASKPWLFPSASCTFPNAPLPNTLRISKWFMVTLQAITKLALISGCSLEIPSSAFHPHILLDFCRRNDTYRPDITIWQGQSSWERDVSVIIHQKILASINITFPSSDPSVGLRYGRDLMIYQSRSPNLMREAGLLMMKAGMRDGRRRSIV
jgi:hypothetical protein